MRMRSDPAPAGAEMLYFFENFVLDPARRELRRGSALIAVQPQVFDLLEYLITNRDRVVSKDVRSRHLTRIEASAARGLSVQSARRRARRHGAGG
jgi:DNA-binding response OmpR family regulator